MINCLISYKCL